MADETMRAVRFHDYGPPESLVVEEVPRPTPGPGEVLLQVHAAGVNPVDWKMRQGMMRNFRPLPLPYIPGYDVSGVVAALGPDVTTLQVGQAVYGRGTGTYAEYAVAPVDALAPKPSNLSFDQAAGVPIGACTAWSAIFDVADLQPGQRLLVHGAAGGVGAYAVQLGHWKGAHVIGTASAANADFVKSLGAETVIDYTATPFESAVHDVDVVMDAIGGDTQQRSWQVLKPGGILVSVAGQPSAEIAQEHGVRASSVQGQTTAERLRQIGALIESGDVIAVTGPVFTLDEAARAHTLSESGHGRGRIILHIAD